MINVFTMIMFLLRALCANFNETRQMIGFSFEQRKRQFLCWSCMHIRPGHVLLAFSWTSLSGFNIHDMMIN